MELYPHLRTNLPGGRGHCGQLLLAGARLRRALRTSQPAKAIHLEGERRALALRTRNRFQRFDQRVKDQFQLRMSASLRQDMGRDSQLRLADHQQRDQLQVHVQCAFLPQFGDAQPLLPFE